MSFRSREDDALFLIFPPVTSSSDGILDVHIQCAPSISEVAASQLAGLFTSPNDARLVCVNVLILALPEHFEDWYQFVAPIKSVLALKSSTPKHLSCSEWLPYFRVFHSDSQWLPDGMVSSTRYVTSSQADESSKRLCISDFVPDRSEANFVRGPYNSSTLSGAAGVWTQTWPYSAELPFLSASCDLRLASKDTVWLGDDYLVVLRHNANPSKTWYVFCLSRCRLTSI